MNRPSRRLRESATTMLKKGRFLAPPRASRITTIAIPERREKTLIIEQKNGSWQDSQRLDSGASAQAGEGAFEPPQDLLHPAFGHHLHHLLSLLELAEQAVDLLHACAGARSDAAFA